MKRTEEWRGTVNLFIARNFSFHSNLWDFAFSRGRSHENGKEKKSHVRVGKREKEKKIVVNVIMANGSVQSIVRKAIDKRVSE